MGSKKHKERDKDHKRKRRHRSRSRSKERKRHRGDERSEQGPENNYEDDNYGRDIETFDYNHGSSQHVEKSQPPSASGGGEASLSIAETNRIRAKLGLKPLEVNSGVSKDSEKKSGEDVHKPAISITQEKQTQKLREKMERMKEKRRLGEKLSKVKTLGESDSEDDMVTWVRKNRKTEKDREKAEKTAKMLEEMDQEFGIGNLVDEEFSVKPRNNYTSKDLKGLKVQHNTERFKEGKTVILTLQDKGILDEDGDDTLINVNMIDDEFTEKNLENKKKKPEYQPYDEADKDEYGTFKPVNVLEKYDEEIEGSKKDKFTLESGGKYDTEQDRQMEKIREQLQQQSHSLGLGVSLHMAKEYFTPEEMAAKASFKKRKKKDRKIRKKQVFTADDLQPLEDDSADFGSRSRGQGRQEVPEVKPEAEQSWYDTSQPTDAGLSMAPVVIDYGHQHIIPGLDIPVVKQEIMETEPVIVPDEDELNEPNEDLSSVPFLEDEAENELQSALSKARRIKLTKDKSKILKVAAQIAEERAIKIEQEMDDDKEETNIVLNSTSEFCRTLGDIPTYGQSGNRDEEKEELMDYERELMEDRKRQEEEEATGWNRVEIDETPVDIQGEEKAVLDDEPLVNQGVGAALELAMKKGYLQKEVVKQNTSANREELEAQNYSIEDKRYDDIDDKYRKRGERYGGGGMLTDFKEKDSYKPDVKLEYVDNDGRKLNEKEAFRQLSHRFHGKGSGKKKQEKRQKKIEEEQLMKTMSSTDTPLGTLNLLKEKQRQEKSSYVVLTGNKGFTSNSIVKN
ncbi:U4/U6.U5 tri-snRNP-associated protein 1-like [Mizuhopecten yessoensis]|uniref:U4/U6.U5 tri-snRNP-associated protein 1-like n=1 Tax=Mizuhopecten yessoensis TaxID=6573 RepID=UPI000B457FBC|nr:U4/U6.U5 tri-snRNP-associated protein 1-like [Mizuhopecten yessoensis]